MFMGSFIRGLLVLVTAASFAAAQAASAPQREPLNDAWWTGPMLAPNARRYPQRARFDRALSLRRRHPRIV